ncbi:hypothetical protein CIK81_03725 [Brachybacterium sp. JB7]|nr:hypothetical protein CIK81_03725 [Brachybacterium sp. JB7]
MTASCPACFARLVPEEARFRCNSGQCHPAPDPEAARVAGYEIMLRPSYRWTPTDGQRTMPDWMPCRRCGGPCNVQACPVCHQDLPPQWRHAEVFTVAVTGARGSGKSVYIGVLIYALEQYLRRSGRTIQPYSTGTKAVYEQRYEAPLFRENRVMEGTPTLLSGGAYQRDPMIWRISDAQTSTFLVVRDAAGEDIETSTGDLPQLSYFGRADLVVFLFDSLRLPSMIQILAGLIPAVDDQRLGSSSAEVLPTVLQQMSGGDADLALAFSKFDAFHELPKADTEHYARVMGNPSAHFNRDETMLRPAGPGRVADAQRWFRNDAAFLDQEIRSLFRLIHEESVTLQADQAAQNKQIRGVGHFAVSAVGETPQHSARLTTRGISPFRVLDPILWGMYRRGISI